MSSGGTSAARASAARQVKQTLTTLLFGKKHGKTGLEENRLLDYSRYSYDDLRKAYLDRLQVIHPDKVKMSCAEPSHANSAEQLKVEFQQLQNAWVKYDELAKSMRKVTGGDGDAANFTLFGVGCSFSDNDQERAWRTEITDQACRGWFSSGLLSDQSANKSETPIETSIVHSMGGTKSLADDSMFVQTSDLEDATNSKYGHQSSNIASAPTSCRKNRTLIPGFNQRERIKMDKG